MRRDVVSTHVSACAFAGDLPEDCSGVTHAGGNGQPPSCDACLPLSHTEARCLAAIESDRRPNNPLEWTQPERENLFKFGLLHR
jgi:hypothetical protein